MTTGLVNMHIDRSIANLVYPLFFILQTSDNDVIFDLFLCRFSVISDVIQKVQRHHDLIKAQAVR